MRAEAGPGAFCPEAEPKCVLGAGAEAGPSKKKNPSLQQISYTIGKRINFIQNLYTD